MPGSIYPALGAAEPTDEMGGLSSDDTYLNRLLQGHVVGSLVNGATAPGRAFAGTLPADQYEQAGSDVAGLATLGSVAMPGEAGAFNAGFRAYHGSPHRFDKFDMSKLGTGEGAQAYGHGLYFADSEGVAQSYRDALQGRDYLVDGQPIGSSSTVDTDPAAMAAHWMDLFKEEPWAVKLRVENAMKRPPGSPGSLPEGHGEGMLAALDNMKGKKFEGRPSGSMYEVEINAEPQHFLDYDAPYSKQSPHVQAALDKLGLTPEPQRPPPRIRDPAVRKAITDAIKANDGDVGYDTLAMTIDNDQAHYNAAKEIAAKFGPWGQQQFEDEGAGYVMTRHPQARGYLDALRNNQRADKTGAELMQALEYKHGATSGKIGLVAEAQQRAAAAQALREAGVPGVRYLDQASRHVDGNETRNTVLFDDSLVNIMRTYANHPNGMAGVYGTPIPAPVAPVPQMGYGPALPPLRDDEA